MIKFGVLSILMDVIFCAFSNWRLPEYQNLVNQMRADKSAKWQANTNNGLPLDNPNALLGMLGTNLDQSDSNYGRLKEWSKTAHLGMKPAGRRLQTTTALPTTYDLRTVYPKCWSIGYIRNQAACGSCWAVSSMSTLSDRYCIKKSTTTLVVQRSFSYEDTMTCCPSATCGINASATGCGGGYLNGGTQYAKLYGVSTGENYQNYTGCKPYSVNPLGTTSVKAGICQSTCAKPLLYTIPYSSDKLKITSSSTYASSNFTANGINAQKAIMARGSLISMMMVYNDFFTYKSGVYSYKLGNFAGYHAIRVIGWGVELGSPYWLCANSWGTSWGLLGFFKILRGSNMAMIDSYFVEGNI